MNAKSNRTKLVITCDLYHYPWLVHYKWAPTVKCTVRITISISTSSRVPIPIGRDLCYSLHGGSFKTSMLSAYHYEQPIPPESYQIIFISLTRHLYRLQFLLPFLHGQYILGLSYTVLQASQNSACSIFTQIILCAIDKAVQAAYKMV